MDFRVLAKILGVLLCLVALAMGVCLAFALIEDWWGMESSAIKALEISAGITVGTGVLLFLLGLNARKEILRREAIAIVGLAWIFSALFGSLPYVFCDPSLSFPKAFFESMSGFTTTGSTTIADLDLYPDSILLWRALTQWLGGIGIVVMFVAVLSFLGVGSRSLMQHESSVNISEGTRARIHDVAATLLKVYVGLTALCALGLWWLGMSPFDAVTHAFTTISTGGFSTHNQSIGHFQSLAIEGWLTLFMMLGGFSFMLYVFVASGNWKRLRNEEEAKFYVLILIIVTLFISLNLWLSQRADSMLEGLQRSFFTVVSISTTTGFGTEDYDQWPVFSKWLLLILMFMGGCAGSTAGGVKMNRIILFFRISTQELVKSFRPKQVFSLRINGLQLDPGIRGQTTFFLILAAFIWGFGTVVVSLIEPSMDFQTSMGATAATMFNIGPGLGDLGPTDNFSGLHPVSLFILSLLMTLGRLEIFAVLVLFMPSLWRKY
jgi:trk system potassium uptake protein TrkH